MINRLQVYQRSFHNVIRYHVGLRQLISNPLGSNVVPIGFIPNQPLSYVLGIIWVLLGLQENNNGLMYNQ